MFEIKFEMNAKVDAMDLEGVWREASIKHVFHDDVYEVHYIGWSNKWNEIISGESNRILPAFTVLKDWRLFLKINDPVEIKIENRWRLAKIVCINGNTVKCKHQDLISTRSLLDEDISEPDCHFYHDLMEVIPRKIIVEKSDLFYTLLVSNNTALLSDFINKNPNSINAFVHQIQNCPVGYAIQQENMSLLKFLLENGASVNGIFPNNVPCLHYLINQKPNISLDFLTVLVEYGCNVNEKDARMTTPLHRFAMKGNVQACQFLLSRGAFVNSMDMNYITPLRHAVFRGELKVVELLLRYGASPRILDKHGIPMKNIACNFKNSHLVNKINKLLENGSWRYNLQKMKYFKIKFGDELLDYVLNTDLFYELIRFF
jgi:hypothetical protein